MDMTPKSKRVMTKEEVALLLDLVSRKPVITSKETNAPTNKLKEEAWILLTAQFNASSGNIPRQKEQLKLKWDNLKKAARKRTQLIRKSSLQSSGSKQDYVPPDEILDKVAELMNCSYTEVEAPFEEDMVLECDPIPEIAIPINEARKRKFKTAIKEITKMAHELETDIGRNNKEDNGNLTMNLAIADYYKAKTKKIELEIEVLQMEVAAKKKLLDNKDDFF